MNEQQKMNLLIILNILELSKRTLETSVGNDLSSEVGNINVFDDAEALLEPKLRQRLTIKG